MLKEFREFISRGNVFDLAIGIIIGAAFGRIVTSFVEDLLMPIVASCWATWILPLPSWYWAQSCKVTNWWRWQ